jgi:hypothetical protein
MTDDDLSSASYICLQCTTHPHHGAALGAAGWVTRCSHGRALSCVLDTWLLCLCLCLLVGVLVLSALLCCSVGASQL